MARFLFIFMLYSKWYDVICADVFFQCRAIVGQDLHLAFTSVIRLAQGVVKLLRPWL